MPVEYVPAPSFDDIPESSNDGYDVITQVREATNSPSPLTLLLQDTVLENLVKSKPHKQSRRTSRSPHREHRSPYIMAVALAEEERQANHLKALLRNTGDRLEFEIRRADEASSHADYAERRASEALARATTAEKAKSEAQVESLRREHEAMRCKLQLESAERDTRRLEDELRRMEQAKKEIQEAAERAKESSRKYQIALRDYEVRDEGREEARRLLMEKRVNESKDEGWENGYAEGYEEGRSDGYVEGLQNGRKQGLREGKEQGRNEERRNALEAFDRFLAEEMDGNSQGRRRWAQSIYHPDAASTESTESFFRSNPSSTDSIYR